MAIKLPEIPLHFPPSPVPESKGKSRWYENPLLRVGMTLATVGAGAGLAYQLFLGADRGSSAPVTSNAPITDTVKPPTDSGPAVSVVIPPSADVTPSTQTGGEVKQPAEWEKSYVMISAQEAQRLLDANPGSMIFPVDPRNAPNLKVENVSFQMPGGTATVIGIKNVPAGENVGSVVPGNAKVSMSVAGGGTLAVGATIDSGTTHYGILARREGAIPQIDPKNTTGSPVGPGTPLFTIGTDQPLGFYPGEQQIIVQSYGDGDQIYRNSVDQFLKVDGKRVFVGGPQK